MRMAPLKYSKIVLITISSQLNIGTLCVITISKNLTKEIYEKTKKDHPYGQRHTHFSLSTQLQSDDRETNLEIPLSLKSKYSQRQKEN